MKSLVFLWPIIDIKTKLSRLDYLIKIDTIYREYRFVESICVGTHSWEWELVDFQAQIYTRMCNREFFGKLLRYTLCAHRPNRKLECSCPAKIGPALYQHCPQFLSDPLIKDL